MANDNITAIVAIVIAIIAFFVTVGQLLQQVFATAEGYRRCQAPVIGQWAQWTHRNWVWKEFRFQTTFVTPDIVLHRSLDSKAEVRMAERRFLHRSTGDRGAEGVQFVTGNSISRSRTYVKEIGSGDKDRDLVGWLRLLDRIHVHQSLCSSMLKPGENGSDVSIIGRRNPSVTIAWPAVTFRPQTWDFVSPDIVRPCASSTVGDIIALSHRLGMAWSEKDLRPGDGVMRAEGNGQSISSTVVRGFGLLLQYTYDEASHSKTTWNDDGEESRSNPLADLTIPTEEADKLGFQIIPGLRCLGLPDFEFHNYDNHRRVLGAMEDLGIGRDAREHYRKYMDFSRRYCGFSDLLAIVAPFMPLWHSSIVRVIAPHPDVHDTPMRRNEAFSIFHDRLSEVSEHLRSGQMNQVLQRYKALAFHKNVAHRSRWTKSPSEAEMENGGDNDFVDFVDDIHHHWEWATQYFLTLKLRYKTSRKRFRYRDLVAAHISQGIYYPTLYEQRRKDRAPRIRGSPAEWDGGARLDEGMHLYIDRIDEVVKFMRSKGFGDFEGEENDTEKVEQIVRDAWWTMMFRAMCWNRGAYWITGPRPGAIFGVPPSFHRSKIPVFIA